MPEDGADALDKMLTNVSKEVFFRDYWEERILHDVCKTENRFAKLLDVKQLDSLLAFGRLRQSQLRVIDKSKSIQVFDYLAHEQNSGDPKVDPKKVMELYRNGATLGFNAVNFATYNLNQFCLSLGRIFSSRVQANIYLTPPAAQGLSPHFDTHCVFLLQILGEKAWKIYGTPVEFPMKNQPHDRMKHEKGDLAHEVTLRTGSMLYIPRGVMHEGVAGNDEPSCHITIGVHTQKWGDALRHVVVEALTNNIEIRKSVPPRTNPNFKLNDVMEEVYTEFLSSVSNKQFFMDALSSAVQLHDSDSSQLLVNGQLESVARVSEVHSKSTVRIIDGIQFTLESSGDRVVLKFGKRSLEFPPYVKSTLEFICEMRRMDVDQIDGELDDKSVLVLVRRLIKEGFLNVKI